jgi:anaerobic ribonucleoside-triphosphate reductase
MSEKTKLHTGLYRCTHCGEEYDCIRLRPEHLTCIECGHELTWSDPVQIYVRRYPDSYQIHRRASRRKAG